jgi:hypothetical protein
VLHHFLGVPEFKKEKYIKSKLSHYCHLSSWSNLVIIGTTKFEPNVEGTLSAKQFWTSHWWVSFWTKYVCSAQTLMKILFLWGK